MLAVLADTHGRDDHRLDGRGQTAVETAELVIHAGDFTTVAVLDAFERAADDLRAVAGNNDVPAVHERLPGDRIVEHEGFRIAVVHGHEHTDTTLPLFGKQSAADLVIVGHSHRPGFERMAGVPILNPGSHADPRRFQPAHAELTVADGILRGRLVDPSGDTFHRFNLPRAGDEAGAESR